MLKKGRFLFLIVAIIEIAMYFIPVSSEVFAVYKEENMLKENSIEVTNEEADDTNEIENNNSYKVANTAQNDSGEPTVPEGYSKFESEETKKWNQSVNVVENAGASFTKWMGEDNPDGLFLVGHYQFNYTGGSAVPRGALDNASLYQCNQNSEYFSKLSRLKEYEWVKYFEQDKQSENVTIPGNSSAGTLKKPCI